MQREYTLKVGHGPAWLVKAATAAGVREQQQQQQLHWQRECDDKVHQRRPLPHDGHWEDEEV